MVSRAAPSAKLNYVVVDRADFCSRIASGCEDRFGERLLLLNVGERGVSWVVRSALISLRLLSIEDREGKPQYKYEILVSGREPGAQLGEVARIAGVAVRCGAQLVQ